MFKITYLNPYSGKQVVRFFRTIYFMTEHITSFNCPLPVLVESDLNEYHLYYDPSIGWCGEKELLDMIGVCDDTEY